MIPIQALVFLYAGMLLESPERRKQFMQFVNGAGTEIEKVIKEFGDKGGAVKDEPVETAAEPEEFR